MGVVVGPVQDHVRLVGLLAAGHRDVEVLPRGSRLDQHMGGIDGQALGAVGGDGVAEVDVLGGLDCDLVQGFVFSPPIAADKAPLVAASIEREAYRIQPKRKRH